VQIFLKSYIRLVCRLLLYLLPSSRVLGGLHRPLPVRPFITMAQTFPRFRELPAELRLWIWQDALPGARTIHLIKDVKWDGTQMPPRRKRQCLSTIPCPKTIISMLHVCAESRAVVLKRYTALFSPRSLGDPYFSLHYFDPSTDGIFVDDIWPWVRGGNSKPAGLYETKRLSISCNTWWSMWRRYTFRKSLLGKTGLLRFKNLEELNIVFRILTDQEREQIMHYRFGQYMGPGDMSTFLRRPHDIDFPGSSVDITIEPILENFRSMKAANPGWNMPKVKLIAWASRPSSQEFRPPPNLLRTEYSSMVPTPFWSPSSNWESAEAPYWSPKAGLCNSSSVSHAVSQGWAAISSGS